MSSPILLGPNQNRWQELEATSRVAVHVKLDDPPLEALQWSHLAA